MSDWGSTNRLPAHVALVEGVILDGDLHLLTRPAYPQPGGSETPLEMLNRPDQKSVGAGEAPMGPTAAAIANAVHAALGVRVRDLPLTPERVAAAMG